jgi:hypothetical protein
MFNRLRAFWHRRDEETQRGEKERNEHRFCRRRPPTTTTPPRQSRSHFLSARARPFNLSKRKEGESAPFFFCLGF